jgi:hypothetical protein
MRTVPFLASPPFTNTSINHNKQQQQQQQQQQQLTTTTTILYNTGLY